MRLSEFLEGQGLTAGQFADRLGVSAEAVRLWAAGQRIPKPEYMQKIATETGGAVRSGDFYGEPTEAA